MIDYKNDDWLQNNDVNYWQIEDWLQNNDWLQNTDYKKILTTKETDL